MVQMHPATYSQLFGVDELKIKLFDWLTAHDELWVLVKRHWLIYRDMKLMETAVYAQTEQRGGLRVLASFEDGPTVGHQFPLLTVTRIGRSATTNVVLADNFASSEHLMIIRRGEQYWLQDLDSRNGTLLNGLPLGETAVVTNGDIITIGDTQLQLES